MSVFLDILRQHSLADAAFEDVIVKADQADDDDAFYQGLLDRDRNNQAYFLFLFTRLEDSINQAFVRLTANRKVGLWPEVRVWSVWDGKKLSEIPLLLKASLLLDKGRAEYADVKEYYDGRNKIAHGSSYDKNFFVPQIAKRMVQITGKFIDT